MDIRTITTFLTVTEERSFTRAAERLGYTQAAVTLQIQQLERELGVKLFDRIGKNIGITQYGMNFIEYARAVAVAVNNASSFTADLKNLGGRIRIGTMESLLTSDFNEIIPEYHNKFPNVQTYLFVGSVPEIYDKLKKNELDFGYTIDYKTAAPDRITELEIPAEIVVVANSRHPLAARKNIRLEEIVDCPFVLMGGLDTYRNLFDAELAKKQLEIRPFLELHSVSFVVSLLKSNPYLSCLPKYSIEKETARGQLKILDIPELEMSQYIQVFYHKNKVITPQIRGFIDTISEFNSKRIRPD